MPHKMNIRVYYEDTDAGGVVYYANYLKFAERARTEMLREAGIDQSVLDILFVVRRAELDLKYPARLDDMIEIVTHITSVGGASLEMEQMLSQGGKPVAEIKVQVACVNTSFRPVRIPKEIKYKLQ